MSYNDQWSAPFQRPLNQICFLVENMEEAALRWHAMTGAGPFYLARHIPFKTHIYMGETMTLDQSSAIGNWGPTQLELFEQHDDSPSGMKDLFPTWKMKGFGVIQHVCVVAPDLDAETKRFTELGYPPIWTAELVFPPNQRITMFDTRPLTGSVTEVYEQNAVMEELYRQIREASLGWDGERVIREISELKLDGVATLAG
jgi:hypothetical protein